MPEPMLSLSLREPPAQVDSDADSFAQPAARLPRLDYGAERESWWHEFVTSVRDSFSGPRATKDAPASSEELRVDWIEGKAPGRAFLASCLWHVAFIWVLLLPIWSFLHTPPPTLAPVQIDVTYYAPPEDLPQITLPAAVAKPAPAAAKPTPDNSAAAATADAFSPKQTILSIPVHVTHPRQTLIQPDAPPEPPKVTPQLPNIVQWTENVPKPQLALSAANSTPRMRQRDTRTLDAPEVTEKNTVPVIPAPISNPQLQVPVSAASAPTARQRTHEATTAPEVGGASSESNLHPLIALSATPAPPAPEVSVPQGNLAARISVSPEGGKGGAGGVAGSSASAANGAATGAANHGATSAAGAAAGIAGGNAAAAGTSGSLPAAISISGGERSSAPGAVRPRKLNLNPTTPLETESPARRGPMTNVAGLDPEKILSGKEVYTLNVNLPNLTSASGSWILNFAQLDEDDRPGFRPKGQLSGPVPIEKVDPKYPPDMIDEHVRGEVILYAIIRKNGTVDSIQVVHGIEPQLDRNAIEALGQWKFRPATREGAPVDLEAVVHIPFTYKNPNE
jgi:TonB family protein